MEDCQCVPQPLPHKTLQERDRAESISFRHGVETKHSSVGHKYKSLWLVSSANSHFVVFRVLQFPVFLPVFISAYLSGRSHCYCVRIRMRNQ